MNDTQVLIVGAGPTGLALALFLAKAGLQPRIIEKNSGPGQASRAMAVQARTLEFYRQLGFADEFVSQGIPIEAIYLRAHGQATAEIKIKDFGEGLSPYPFILSFPQDDHERLLVKHLAEAGVEVEWETELMEQQDTGAGIRVVLQKPGSMSEESTVDYLCGCDGAHSLVRESLGLGFAGGTYEKNYFVADVEATGEAAGTHSFSLCLGEHDFLIVLPVRRTGMHRLIGVIPEEVQKELTAGEAVTFEALRPYAEKAARVSVQTVNWFSTYKVHHRVADHFRVGRAFLLGDAGHIHSPVGGQGMNTGIGDAVNLAWKLAAVVQGNADGSLLDTYETERIAFAHSLVATTDQLFQLITGSGWGNTLFRETVLPHLAPFALGFAGVRTAAFRLVSQTRLHYSDSALSAGAAGEVHGGDRLPWVLLAEGTDNFAPLASADWQGHIYGVASQSLREAASAAALPLHEFDWAEAMAQAGLKRDALYLIRPDGYVALADAGQKVEAFQEILARFHLRPRR